MRGLGLHLYGVFGRLRTSFTTFFKIGLNNGGVSSFGNTLGVGAMVHFPHGGAKLYTIGVVEVGRVGVTSTQGVTRGPTFKLNFGQVPTRVQRFRPIAS